MTIPTIGIKGDDNVWTNASQVRNDLGDGFCGICLVQVAVNVIEKFYIAYAQFLRGVEQFYFAQFAEGFQARVIFFVTEPAAFATRGSDQIGLDSFGSIFR